MSPLALLDRLARAQKKLQAAQSSTSRSDSLSSLLDAFQIRLDALSRVTRGGAGHLDPRGLHAAPEVAFGNTRLIDGAWLPGQQHRISEATHGPLPRFDQPNAGGDGQPCGETFISPKYVCRVGKNIATTADLNVHLEADPDRVDDIKRAIRHYSNTPRRIQQIQARIAIQAGWDVGVYGWTQDERLSRLGLNRVDLKEARDRAELLENYIEKAPKYEGDVYRGVWFGSSKEAENFLTDLQERYVPAVDSWTATQRVAESFSGVSEPRSAQKAAVILKQRNVHGASIKRYSSLPEEDEVLQPSGLKYRILAITERVEGSLARPLTIYEVDVEPIEHRPMARKTVMDRLDALEARLDALKRKCTTGYSCGSTCITVKKECRSNPAAATSKERIQRLQQLAKGEIKPRGIGVPKVEEARAIVTELQAQRQQQQTLIKAERQRRREQAAATGQKPSVKVNLRRAKPGGEYGPDGHWYPGGSWMSEGAYVGIKSQPIGTGSQAGRGEGEKGGNLEPRVIQPKAKPRRIRPLEPRGEGLPRPTGLKKTAAQNDQEWFNDRGYLIYPRPEGSQYRGLQGSHFEAAVIQRMTTKELEWATSQILRMAKRSPEDHAEMLLRVKDTDNDIKRMGGLEAWAENERWTSRRQLIGVDDKRLRAGLIFMNLSGFLGSTSPAAQRLRKQWREYDEDRAPLPEFPGEDGARAWALNNVFRAVARRRKAASGSRRDALQPPVERLERLDARIKQAPGQLGLDLSGAKGKGRGPGGGEPCGRSWIDPNKNCLKKGGTAGKPLHPLFQEAMERRQAQAAAAAAAQKKAAQAQSAPGLQLGQDQQGQLLVNGKPAKRLSKGNYGDTYKVDTPEGPVLVKVDRLNGGDPQEDDPGVSREQQRLNMANRELDNLRRAAALGVGPEPIGEVVKLPADGRFAIAYRMVEGAPLKASFTSTEPDTPEAAAILEKPGARERLDAGVLRIARVMADAGLEHGDLHGANIVVQRDGSPKLIDWGIGGHEPPGDAANRAQLEARLLLQMNYYTQTLNRHSPDGKAVAEGIDQRLTRAQDGLQAARKLQDKFDIEWEEENLSPDEFMPRMQEASRLRKQGLSSDEAQRQAGVLPKVTPQMKMATDKARDALFSDADLEEMRRWVDQQVMGAKR